MFGFINCSLFQNKSDKNDFKLTFLVILNTITSFEGLTFVQEKVF